MNYINIYHTRYISNMPRAHRLFRLYSGLRVAYRVLLAINGDSNWWLSPIDSQWIKYWEHRFTGNSYECIHYEII